MKYTWQMNPSDLADIASLADKAKGQIHNIYLHWSAGTYEQCYDDYHINIDDKGNVYVTTDDLTEYKPHTWKRNSGAVGISLNCGYGASAGSHGYDADMGNYPPTQAQIEAMSLVVAALCKHLKIPIDKYHVMTHCEAANLDGYGPDSTCERWDLWYLWDNAEQKMLPGGDVIRGKAIWYSGW